MNTRDRSGFAATRSAARDGSAFARIEVDIPEALLDQIEEEARFLGIPPDHVVVCALFNRWGKRRKRL